MRVNRSTTWSMSAFGTKRTLSRSVECLLSKCTQARSLGGGMRRRLGGYRTGARVAKWAFAALILATIPIGALASAAQECAASMARRDRLDHNGFKSRAKRYGLRAENVAYGCATEECARAKWWKSPGHARNMMLPGFKEVASARSRSGRTYWCMEIHE